MDLRSKICQCFKQQLSSIVTLGKYKKGYIKEPIEFKRENILNISKPTFSLRYLAQSVQQNQISSINIVKNQNNMNTLMRFRQLSKNKIAKIQDLGETKIINNREKPNLKQYIKLQLQTYNFPKFYTIPLKLNVIAPKIKNNNSNVWQNLMVLKSQILSALKFNNVINDQIPSLKQATKQEIDYNHIIKRSFCVDNILQFTKFCNIFTSNNFISRYDKFSQIHLVLCEEYFTSVTYKQKLSDKLTELRKQLSIKNNLIYNYNPNNTWDLDVSESEIKQTPPPSKDLKDILKTQKTQLKQQVVFIKTMQKGEQDQMKTNKYIKQQILNINKTSINNVYQKKSDRQQRQHKQRIMIPDQTYLIKNNYAKKVQSKFKQSSDEEIQDTRKHKIYKINKLNLQRPPSPAVQKLLSKLQRDFPIKQHQQSKLKKKITFQQINKFQEPQQQSLVKSKAHILKLATKITKLRNQIQPLPLTISIKYPIRIGQNLVIQKQSQYLQYYLQQIQLSQFEIQLLINRAKYNCNIVKIVVDDRLSVQQYQKLVSVLYLISQIFMKAQIVQFPSPPSAMKQKQLLLLQVLSALTQMSIYDIALKLCD